MAARKLERDEKIIGLNNSTIEDFWSWAFSDLISNANRGVFAEFIVARSLGVTDQVRIEWDAVDIRYRGYKIEVKSAAYVQRWKQIKPSTIRFDISKKTAWDADTNEYSTMPIRASDVFVFSIFEGKDDHEVLNMDFWKFYVLSTQRINSEFGNQQSVGINKLEQVVSPVGLLELNQCINSKLEQ